MEATGHAFVAIGASMGVRKWRYLKFYKGVPPKTVPQGEPVDGKTVGEARWGSGGRQHRR